MTGREIVAEQQRRMEDATRRYHEWRDSFPSEPVFEEPPFRCAQPIASRATVLSVLLLLAAGLVFFWRW